MKKCSEETRDRICWLLDLEQRPRTLNDHYFADYRDKFLAYYKGRHHASGGYGSLIQKLENYEPAAVQPMTTTPSLYNADAFATSTAKILSGLSELGLQSKATDLPKLLPSDPYEPALHIMATVRAYFQGKIRQCPLPSLCAYPPMFPCSCVQAFRGQRAFRYRPRAHSWPCA